MGVFSVILASAIVAAAFALVAAGFAWPVYGLIRWSGGWRLLAAKVGTVSADLSRDPTSHNLLPFELGILVLPVPVYMLVLTVLRRARRAGA